VERSCSRVGYSCLSDLIGIEGIAKFEIHKKKSTSKTPDRIMRTMFCSAVIELRQGLSGTISDLIFPDSDPLRFNTSLFSACFRR
jgi:hypothetical protein